MRDDFQMGAPTTGYSIDSAPGIRLRNFIASGLVVAVAAVVYSAIPVHREALVAIQSIGGHPFSGMQFLEVAVAIYIGLLGLYYGFERAPGPSKSLVTLSLAMSLLRSPEARLRQRWSSEERLAVLGTLLKAFFGPLMVVSLMRFTVGWINNGAAIFLSGGAAAGFAEMFNQHGYWFAMQVILFVDVLLFTLGYLVELPVLKNEIRSVDSSLLGWSAALLCYPPFNQITGYVLGSQVSDFPQFDNPTAHLILNILLLSLMALYASASVALGFKASNLTHRGIVSRGPYALIRHPAYACKNMAWWIGSIPMVSAAFAQSWFAGVTAVASVVGWTMLYALRALTEEDHLRRVDGEYEAYAKRVPYRFIPGVV